MRVLITRPMTQAAERAISARFDADFRDTNTPLSAADLRAAMSEYDSIIPTLGDALTAEAFPSAPRCRLLANFGAGYNHIDLTAAQAAGVAVTNTPDVVTEATADLAVTLLLMTARRAGEGERLVRAGQWSGWNPTQMLGQPVSGRVAGIVGMGRIGRAIAERLYHGFGMRVVFHNRSRLSSLDLPARQLDQLDDVLDAADFIILAVPGGAGTRHMIDANALRRMRRDAILINVARGDVVDEAALVAALTRKEIAGAGLDVYENEPQLHPDLMACEKAVLLPHLGTAVEATRTAMALRAFDNLIAHSEGRGLPDQII